MEVKLHTKAHGARATVCRSGSPHTAWRRPHRHVCSRLWNRLSCVAGSATESPRKGPALRAAVDCRENVACARSGGWKAVRVRGKRGLDIRSGRCFPAPQAPPSPARHCTQRHRVPLHSPTRVSLPLLHTDLPLKKKEGHTINTKDSAQDDLHILFAEVSGSRCCRGPTGHQPAAALSPSILYGNARDAMSRHLWRICTKH